MLVSCFTALIVTVLEGIATLPQTP